MNKNSEVIIGLCSFMCVGDGVRPYEPSEWSALAEKLIIKKMQPSDLTTLSNDDFKNKLQFSDDDITRVMRLFDRMGSLSFEIRKYANLGINIVTRADIEYPSKIKKVLAKISPPLFYYAGDIGITDDDFIGFVGSRTVDEQDSEFTQSLVKNVTGRGYSIVSGGAKGIDSISTEHALSNGKVAVEFLSDSLMRRIKDPLANRAIRDGRLVVISSAKPDAPFNTGMAMSRNKLLYASSIATVVIKSDYNKGGTWAGATEALRQRLTNVFCWQNENYKGNIELIRKGAIPIQDDEWNGANLKYIEKQVVKQATLFDMLDTY